MNVNFVKKTIYQNIIIISIYKKNIRLNNKYSKMQNFKILKIIK